MKDSEIVDNFMTQIMSVVNQLWKYGEDLPNQRVIEKLLRCLPKKFEAVVVPIEEFKNIRTDWFIACSRVKNQE